MFFEYPKLLWLLVIPALLVLHYIWQEVAGRHPHMRVSSSVPWTVRGRSFMALLRHVPFLFRILALSLIILAIARPRSSEQMEKIDTEKARQVWQRVWRGSRYHPPSSSF